MTIRKVPLVDGEYYHIYSRGNSKQRIFLDKEDYQYLINCLYCFNTYKRIKSLAKFNKLVFLPSHDSEAGKRLKELVTLKII